MNRKQFIPLVILCSLGILYFVGNITGAFRTATLPATANEPNVKLKSRIWFSNLAKPERFKFILYKMEADEARQEGIWMMRLCGLPGDVIQIINGTLFVNGKDADASLNLKKEYLIPKSELKKLDEKYIKDHRDDIPESSENDSIDLFLETAAFKSRSIAGHLYVGTETDEAIQKIYHQPWNRDNFGPLTVPPDKFFVMGDNRHQAADSRYTGLIDQDKYVGTVLFR
jgi:signal peptidase I